MYFLCRVRTRTPGHLIIDCGFKFVARWQTPQPECFAKYPVMEALFIASAVFPLISYAVLGKRFRLLRCENVHGELSDHRDISIAIQVAN
jgi:hypothetical protein